MTETFAESREDAEKAGSSWLRDRGKRRPLTLSSPGGGGGGGGEREREREREREGQEGNGDHECCLPQSHNREPQEIGRGERQGRRDIDATWATCAA